MIATLLVSLPLIFACLAIRIKLLLMRHADDSAINLTAGETLGWKCVHLLEPDLVEPEKKACQHQIRDLEELRDLFPHFFKSSAT